MKKAKCCKSGILQEGVPFCKIPLALITFKSTIKHVENQAIINGDIVIPRLMTALFPTYKKVHFPKTNY